MLFLETRLPGPRLIELEPMRDQRGFFARTFCEREFEAHGLPTRFPQHSLSGNVLKGTVRGMHFQVAPYAEAKVVRCARGAVFDVLIDVRGGSETRGQWEAFELTAENHRQLFIPEGFAHGFQALTDEAEVAYMISAFHAPGQGLGFRYDDPAFSISWPLPVATVSDRDLSWPPFVT